MKNLFSLDLKELELKVASRSCEGIQHDDPHVSKAAEMFNIPQEQVTKEQRQLAKLENYKDWYNR